MIALKNFEKHTNARKKESLFSITFALEKAVTASL